MQLQYCDGCSTRIEVDKAVTDGDKTYCRECAAKLGLKPPPPSESGSRLAAAGGGNRAAALFGSGARHPSIAAGGTRAGNRPPSTIRRPIAATPGGPNPVSSTHIPVPRRGLPHGDTTKVALVAPPPVQAPAQSAAPREWNFPVGKANLARAVMAAGIVLGLIGLILIIRGGKGNRKPKPGEAVKPVAAVEQQTPKKGTTPATDSTKEQAAKKVAPEPEKPPQHASKEAPPEHENAAPTKDETALPRMRRPGLGMMDTSFDAREDMAKREVERLLELDKSGKGNAFDKRKRWEAFAATPSGRTKTGQAAVTERLKALPYAKSRPPDNPANTQPGLEAQVYEMNAESVPLRNVSVTGLKLHCTKVWPNVDIADKKQLGKLTDGREENVLVRLSGYIEVPREGVYSFWTKSDDGSMAYIGDNLIVNNDGDHPAREAGGPMPYALQAGKHEYRVDYFQGRAEAELVLSWSALDMPKQVIPATAFSH